MLFLHYRISVSHLPLSPRYQLECRPIDEYLLATASGSVPSASDNSLLSDQIFRRELRLLLSLFRNQSQADVRLALNVSRDITADVGARSASQVAEVAAEIIDAGRRPPEAERLRVLVELFARIKIVSFQQGLGALELFVGVIVLVVEVRDFVVDRFERGLALCREWSER